MEIAETDNITKVGVSVTEMARMVNLSVRRFYQLLDAEVFPMPVYLISTRKPHYTEEQQRVCLEVRRRQCGINGNVVFFHTPRATSSAAPKRERKSVAAPAAGRHTALREGLTALGMEAVSDRQIDAAVEQEFPAGRGQAAEFEVVRRVFLRLKTMKIRDDNVGR